MSIDFALIGHQESWKAASDVIAVLRGQDLDPIPEDEVQEMLPWIPPRAVCRIEAKSIQGTRSRGLYIDSFIPPDRLDSRYLRENLARVRQAQREGTVFTTGNTLTVAFIFEGIRKLCKQEGRTLSESKLLIVGATGDVGSGCALCFAPFVKEMVLSARNAERLERLAIEIEREGTRVEIVAGGQPLPVDVDIVICAASLPSSSLTLGGIAADAIVCDAGYPKNLSNRHGLLNSKVFFGGLGQIRGGMTFTPELNGVLNRHPFPNVVHGCLLEGMALALEGRFEAFSRGRGLITRQRVDEIHEIATRHGIVLAPFYNADGPLERAANPLTKGSIA
jgi:fatty aldehyde-generating acyl-ACP reductase